MGDPVVKILNSAGYQAVFLPRSGVLPPDLYSVSDKRLVRHGPLVAYVPQVKTLVRTSGVLGNWGGTLSTAKGASASARFLEHVLGCIGVGAPGLDVASIGKQGLHFAFVDVKFEAVEPSSLVKLLQTIPREAFPEFLLKAPLHIAYEYAFASKLKITRGNQREERVDMNAALTNVIGAHAKVSVGSDSVVYIEANDSSRRAFAYKAALLQWGDGGWELYPEVVKPRMGDDLAASAYVPVRGVPMLVADSERP